MRLIDVDDIVKQMKLDKFNTCETKLSELHMGYNAGLGRAVDIIEMIETPECENISELHPVDGFICSECGVILEQWSRVNIDEEDSYYSQECAFRYCPNCGRKIKVIE